jgi:hypothetical protein
MPGFQKCNLPSPEEILENPPKKQQWKNAMKKVINSFWYDKWTSEMQIIKDCQLY